MVLVFLLALFGRHKQLDYPSSLPPSPSPSPAGAREWYYRFASEMTDSGRVLHVTLEFQGNDNGVEEIGLPVVWNDEKARPAKDLRAISSHTTLSENAKTGKLILRYPPGGKVALTYVLLKDWKGSLRSPLQFHPVIMQDYMEINGKNSLVHPRLAGDDSVIVHFDWRGLPATWVLATSFGTDTTGSERHQTYSGKWRAIERALFSAGDFRIRSCHIHGYPVILAIRGQWVFPDSAAMAAIQKAISIVRSFWNDFDFPYFLVTCKPFDVDHGQTNGSAYTNAFWMYLSRKDSLVGRMFATLVHETFHIWNTQRMGNTPEGQTATDWFHEGVTDFYGNTLAFRAGLLPLPDYLQVINRDLRDYCSSKSPYVHGLVIALWLDNVIRNRSGGKSSLKEVMYDMLHDPGLPLTNARIYATAGKYLRPEDQQTLRKAVEDDSLPRIAPEALDRLGSGISLTLDSVSLYDLGFDLNASIAAGRTTGVRVNGPAFRAGLREGQTLLKYSSYNDAPDKEATFVIQTDADTRTIRYFPRGKTIIVQQAHQTASAPSSGS